MKLLRQKNCGAIVGCLSCNPLVWSKYVKKYPTKKGDPGIKRPTIRYDVKKVSNHCLSNMLGCFHLVPQLEVS